MHKQEKMLFIVGPTAVGKTDVGFLLAQKLGGEIISCDAMQVYREVNLATSKPPAEMRNSVPHHLLDVLSVTQEFDVASFNQQALAAVAKIRAHKKIPIVVGGSGMYMQVLLDGIFTEPAHNPQVRKELAGRITAEGSAKLYEELARSDPAAAAKIHPHDNRRIIRALEVYLITKKPISVLQKHRQGLWGRVPIKIFCLTRPRAELYGRINQRVEEMFTEGLIAEIEALRGLKLSRTAQAIIGVKEVQGYLAEKHTIADAKEQMKLNTRHLAKRQLTWFRKDKRLEWIEISSSQTPQDIVRQILGIV